jgi:hypothetical protein
MKRQQQIDPAGWAFVAFVIIVTIVAAIVTLIQAKPELFLLLMWHAGHPL